MAAKKHVPPLQLDQDHVMYLLSLLSHSLRQTSEVALREAKLDLSMTQLMTLSLISSHPGLPGARIAKRLGVTAQSLNGVLKTLEDRGMLVREEHPDSLRAFSWYITETGSTCVARAVARIEGVFTQMQVNFSAAERKQFVELLKRGIAGLGPAAQAGF